MAFMACNYCKIIETLNYDILKLKYCGRCHTASYCSKICQIKDWSEGHKIQCKFMKYKWLKSLCEEKENQIQIMVEYKSFCEIEEKNPKYSLAYVTLYLKMLKFEKINFLILFGILKQFRD
jgi:hypothetical protein